MHTPKKSLVKLLKYNLHMVQINTAAHKSLFHQHQLQSE